LQSARVIGPRGLPATGLAEVEAANG